MDTPFALCAKLAPDSGTGFVGGPPGFDRAAPSGDVAHGESPEPSALLEKKFVGEKKLKN